MKFGDEVKDMTIGQKRIEKIPKGVGPGEYSPERADEVTKANAPKYNLGTGSPSRAQLTFANQG